MWPIDGWAGSQPWDLVGCDVKQCTLKVERGLPGAMNWPQLAKSRSFPIGCPEHATPGRERALTVNPYPAMNKQPR